MFLSKIWFFLITLVAAIAVTVALGDGPSVDVSAKGKTELNTKIPAAALQPGAKK